MKPTKDPIISLFMETDNVKDLAYQITGAIFEVNHALGCGFLEAVYQEALEIELRSRGLKTEPQKRIKIQYKGTELQCEYVADIVVEEKVIIEVKAISGLDNIHKAQVINYLKATNLPYAILVNFGTPRVEIERYDKEFAQRKI